MSAPVQFEAVVAPTSASQPRAADAARWPAQVALAAATLVLHALLLAPTLLGTVVHGQNGSGSGVGALAALIYITLPATDDSSALVPAASPLPTDADWVKLNTVGKNALQQDAPAAGDSDHSRPDPPAEAMVFARYLGQVTARLQAAWHPAASLIKGMYRCRIHLTQAADGVVERLDMQQCGSEALLLQAVQSALEKASPLPPHPGQATGSVELDLLFEAEVNAVGALQTRVIPAGAA